MILTYPKYHTCYPSSTFKPSPNHNQQSLFTVLFLSFDVALKGIESGYRQCFRSLPADLSQHRILCDTYDFLRVDVLGGQSINEILRDLKSGRSDYDREERREIKGDKSKARDTAFKLLYLIFLRDFKDEMQDSAKIFNAAMLVYQGSSIH